MDPRALSGSLQCPRGMDLGVDHEMAEMVTQRNEIAFGVDNGLLDPGHALFQQPAQKM